MSASVGATLLVGATVAIAGAHLCADADRVRRKSWTLALVDDRSWNTLADVAAVIILFVAVGTVHHTHDVRTWFCSGYWEKKQNAYSGGFFIYFEIFHLYILRFERVKLYTQNWHVPLLTIVESGAISDTKLQSYEVLVKIFI